MTLPRHTLLLLLYDNYFILFRSDKEEIGRGDSSTPKNHFPTHPAMLTAGAGVNKPEDTDGGSVEDDVTSDLTKDAESQTKKLNLMKEYLPAIRDHRTWRTEKGDPFIEVSKIQAAF